MFPEPVVSTVPVPDKLDVPEILKFEADEAVAPKETEVAPKVTAEFANEPFAIFVSVLSGPLIVLFVSVSVDVSVTTAPSVAIVNVLLDIDVVIPEIFWKWIPFFVLFYIKLFVLFFFSHCKLLSKCLSVANREHNQCSCSVDSV